MYYLIILFVAKLFDNMLGTAKTILVQRNYCVWAGLALSASSFLYLSITKSVVTADSYTELLVVSVASGVGCCLAVAISNKLSKEKTYVNVIMSDDLDAMKAFRDFLASEHITNVAADSYTRDWSKKTITITAYAETKDQSRSIDRYIEHSDLKFKRVISKH